MKLLAIEQEEGTRGFECVYKEHYEALPAIRDAVVKAVRSCLADIRIGETYLGTITGVFKYPRQHFGDQNPDLSVDDSVTARLLAEGVAVVLSSDDGMHVSVIGDRLRDILRRTGTKPAPITDAVTIHEDIWESFRKDRFHGGLKNIDVTAQALPLPPDQIRSLNAMLSQKPLTRTIEAIRQLLGDIFGRRSFVKSTAKHPLEAYLNKEPRRFPLDLSGKQNIEYTLPPENDR